MHKRASAVESYYENINSKHRGANMALNLSRLPWIWGIWVGILFLGSLLCTMWSNKRPRSRINFPDLLSSGILGGFGVLVADTMEAGGFNKVQGWLVAILVHLAGHFVGIGLRNDYK